MHPDFFKKNRGSNLGIENESDKSTHPEKKA
jgi:hypothetical protein